MNNHALQDIHDTATRGLRILVVSASHRDVRPAFDALIPLSSPSELIRVSRAAGRETITYASGGEVSFVARRAGLGHTADHVYLDWSGAANDAETIARFAPTVATSVHGQIICPSQAA